MKKFFKSCVENFTYSVMIGAGFVVGIKVVITIIGLF